jgi:hypothetical protein
MYIYAFQKALQKAAMDDAKAGMSESAGLKMMDAMYVQRKKLETVFYYFDTNGDGVSLIIFY